MSKRKIIGAAPGTSELKHSLETAETEDERVQLLLASPLVPDSEKKQLVAVLRQQALRAMSMR